ncbi:uncharacterized protein LOC135091045 isoform X1 [Scylla paramamosain]|uniref:uncharacterized protein LOC135091045 isoform X1 n=1 Tax=Scylla paramamosain TaxID=85552 RepID=UPI003083586B
MCFSTVRWVRILKHSGLSQVTLGGSHRHRHRLQHPPVVTVMNTLWVLVLMVLLACLAAADPEAARGGVHFKNRPSQLNRRKSRAKKTPPNPVFRRQHYQPYYMSYQAPYDPTGHGDPHFSYFQGR